MDFPVPSWAELIYEATKLTREQEKCCQSTYQLLTSGLPELDRKIMILRGETQMPDPVYDQYPTDELVNNFHDEQDFTLSRTCALIDETFEPTRVEEASIDAHISAEPEKRESIPILSKPKIILKEKQANNTKNVPNNLKSHDNKKTSTRDLRQHNFKKTLSKDLKHHDYKKAYNRDLKRLEQLALPVPLSEYYKLNRPELFFRAISRINYLKRRAEKRRRYESVKIVNSLERMRLSSKRTTNKHPSLWKRVQREQNFEAHEYYVKRNFTEKQMREMTNKIYRSLPEVTEKKIKEDRNHMKVVNYKNRLQYGRRLHENQKHGKINYPIIAASDDISTDSGQDEYNSSEFGRAADTYQADSLY